MRNYLTEHALKNIWCEPIQDRQYIIQPARHTANGGALNSAPVGWVRIPLPIQGTGTNARFFHVYQVGQMAPSLLNISDRPGEWFSAEGLMEANGVLIDVFLLNGAKIPPAYVWVMMTRDKNVLVAIENATGMNLGTILDGSVRKARLDLDDIYIRFYSNQYFDSAEYQGRNNTRPKINVVSQLVRNSTDFSSFWTQCSVVNTDYDSANLGVSRYYVDGFEVNRQTSFNAALHQGRMFTMIRDTSIEEVADFGKVIDLLTFTSARDVGETKLILMGNHGDSRIRYFDDIDFVLSKDDVNNTSLRLPVVNGDEVRMLLHNAWAVNVDQVNAIVNDQGGLWTGINDVRLRAFIRTGGMRFGLINEAQHLKELMKLTREEILGAMTGVSALIDVWRAENLEQSAYTEIMSSPLELIDNDLPLVAEAYGYNAASQLMSNPIQQIIASGGQLSIEMPAAACMKVSADGDADRTIFTYNADGKLVNWLSNHADYSPFILPGVPGQTQATAEVFPMKLSLDHDGVYYHQSVNDLRLKTQGFRVYACAAPGGVPSEEWTDVTEIGLGTYYTYDSVGDAGNAYRPRVTLDLGVLNGASLYAAVKVGGVVTFYKPTLATVNYPGMIRFSVNTLQPGWLGSNPVRIQKLQPGVLDVFMDGECLIENVDYYVNWPEICVVRVPPRTPAEGLQVYARLHGFCNPDNCERFAVRESGFVKGGYLSVDGEYDIRNDRAIRVVVGGGLKRRNQVRFAEDDAGDVVTDGRPYSISDFQMPIENYTGLKTIPSVLAARETDDIVQDYIDLRKEENVPPTPFIIGDRWRLYSPFFSAILHAFEYGFLGAGQLDTPYQSTDITNWVTPYLYLLDYDPCVQSSDLDYVEVRPHQYSAPREVTEKQFAFLHKINLQFLGGKVSMSPGIVIEV